MAVGQGVTGLSTRDTVAAALDYVEDHISESLTLRSIADAAFTSPSHLRRLFMLITGEPLMTYVRLRRLSRSLDTLLATDMRVIDIAHEFGFSCEQAYIRAFRAAFGVAPGSLRRSRKEVIIREPIDAYQLRVAGDGLLYGPTFVKVPSFHVAGRPHRISIGAYFHREQTRYTTDFALFFERVDTAVCDEHTCQMDWLTPVVDNHDKMSSSVKS